MLRPFLKVARPEDWTGTLASFATGAILLILVLSALMARLPPALEALPPPGRVAARSGFVLLSAFIVVWLRAAVYSRLPSAVWLLGRTLSFPVRGRRVRLSTGEVREVFVQRSDAFEGAEVFAITVADGAVFELCPVIWDGAGELYRALARKVRR